MNLAVADLASTTVVGMDARKALREVVREHIEAWLAADPKRNAVQLAALAGLTSTHISTIRSGNRGVGMKALLGLSRALDISVSDLEAEASQRERDAPASPERRVEYEPRYTHLQLAILAAPGEGIRPEIIKEFEGISLESTTDLKVTEWIADMLSRQRQRDREARDPVGTARELAQRQADADAHRKESAGRETMRERSARLKREAEETEAEPPRKLKK